MLGNVFIHIYIYALHYIWTLFIFNNLGRILWFPMCVVQGWVKNIDFDRPPPPIQYRINRFNLIWFKTPILQESISRVENSVPCCRKGAPTESLDAVGGAWCSDVNWILEENIWSPVQSNRYPQWPQAINTRIFFYIPFHYNAHGQWGHICRSSIIVLMLKMSKYELYHDYSYGHETKYITI